MCENHQHHRNVYKLSIKLMNIFGNIKVQGRTDNETKVLHRKTAHLTKHGMESTHPYTKRTLLQHICLKKTTSTTQITISKSGKANKNL